MTQKRMTNSDVERFPSEAEDRAKDKATLWDGEVRGFGCRWFRASGVKTFLMQYRVASTGKIRVMKIGRFNDPWKVDQARAKAVELKMRMVSGVDLREEERERRKAAQEQEALDKALGTTLRQVLESYIKHKRTKHGALRSKTKADLRRHCEKNMPEYLDKPVTDWNRNACLAKFTEITERDAPVQANLCMVYLRALLNHAREMHALPDGTYPILSVNPVTQMFRLRKPNPMKPRTGRVPLNKLGAVWNLLRDRSANARTVHERTAADLVSTLLITGWRLTEAGALKKSAVNLEAKTITLHGDLPEAVGGFEGTKTHASITLPMSDTLHEIMDARINAPEDDSPAARRRRRELNAEYVFPSFGKKRPFLTDARATMEEVSKVAGLHVSPHDLRRTADSIAKAVKTIDSDDRRKLLNHAGPDVHATHYDNESGELLRPAVNAIAKFVTDAAAVARAQARGENVVAFPSKPA